MLKAFALASITRLLRRLQPRQQLSLSVHADLFSLPAATSRPAPSSPPPVDGIPSADAPPPASAEPLSKNGRTKDQRFVDFVDEIERAMGGSLQVRPVRFVALKVWATRIGIVGLVALGFGTFTLFITRSVVGLAIGAAELREANFGPARDNEEIREFLAKFDAHVAKVREVDERTEAVKADAVQLLQETRALVKVADSIRKAVT